MKFGSESMRKETEMYLGGKNVQSARKKLSTKKEIFKILFMILLIPASPLCRVVSKCFSSFLKHY